MPVYVSGSLAFDRIMAFNGNFQDHVLMDKLHMLNISFMVNSMAERRGGCAGNIAYTLALLGAEPLLVSCAGSDFASYRTHLDQAGVRVDGVRVMDDVFTALCYITTDLKGNQITGFYPGAMAFPSAYGFPNLARGDLAIVSPGNMDDMHRLPALYRERGVRFIFDPGQQLPVFTAEQLLSDLEGSLAYVCNDYELGMTCKTLGLAEADLLQHTQWLVTTLGAEGARVRGRHGEDLHIATAPCRVVADPTGAGDAHRAGLLFGLTRGLDVPEAAKLGAVSASFAIECMGTQEHSFSPADFVQRYEATFGAMPFAI
ncbi:MAG: carbohydrate kinase family protein [Desulfovibrio sp.]|jgi:adenosine kinase|nr:carbohydrate kinase family protein [Desulfovibrio sp.]